MNHHSCMGLTHLFTDLGRPPDAPSSHVIHALLKLPFYRFYKRRRTLSYD